MSALLMLAGLLVASSAASDTTFTIPPGATVVVDNTEGDIEITGQDGRRARVLVDRRADRVRVERRGTRFHVVPDTYRDEDEADLLITLPRDVAVEVHGGSGDINVNGFERDVTIFTLDGDVSVAGGAAIAVSSVDGDVSVRGASGPIAINTGDGDVRLDRVSGAISVQGIDGDVTILQASTSSLSVSTVDGDLRYEGIVQAGGHYALATHDGSVTFVLPRGAGARVTVLTYDGSLLPSFPIELRGVLGSTAEFTLGDGAATVRLETFNGDIYLLRPGERRPEGSEGGPQ